MQANPLCNLNCYKLKTSKTTVDNFFDWVPGNVLIIPCLFQTNNTIKTLQLLSYYMSN